MALYSFSDAIKASGMPFRLVLSMSLVIFLYASEFVEKIFLKDLKYGLNGVWA